MKKINSKLIVCGVLFLGFSNLTNASLSREICLARCTAEELACNAGCLAAYAVRLSICAAALASGGDGSSEFDACVDSEVAGFAEPNPR